MNALSRIVSLLGLAAVIVPCILFFAGAMELNVAKGVALAGTIAWFVATPCWMSRKLPVDAAEVEI